MYTGFQHMHSGIAYLTLAALVLVIGYTLVGALSNREFNDKDRKIAMVGLILTHIQVLVGLILYFVSPLGLEMLKSGSARSDSAARLLALEHPMINIIAVVLITIGYSRAKKLATSKAKFRSIYMMYAIGLILILARIPWSAWLG